MDLDPLFAAPIGALLIFLLRILDVSMSIMRMILAVRGHRVIAAIIGFFEVLIWLIAVGSALEHLDSIYHVVGYAGGFAAGNYVGVWLEGQFALGVNVVRAVIRRPAGEPKASSTMSVADTLRKEGYAVTEIEGKGQRSYVDILNVIVPRRRVRTIVQIIRNEDPTAFLSIEEVRAIQGGYIRPGGRKMPFLTRWTRPSTRRKGAAANNEITVSTLLSEGTSHAIADAVAMEMEHAGDATELTDHSRLP